MASGIDVTFLRDTAHFAEDKDQPEHTAAMLAEFIGGAKQTLDVAIYDLKLTEDRSAKVVDAFKQAAGRGVTIRIGYDADKPAEQTTAAFAALGADPAPPGTEVWLKANLKDVAGITFKPIISPGQHLMHSKYVVRDIDGEHPALWMGSANFTDGAWTRQENNIVRFASSAVAQAYHADFEEMWEEGKITGTGKGAGGTTVGGVTVGWEFSPAGGKAIDAHLAATIAKATGKVRISSMVITSGAVLSALKAAIGRNVVVDGVYDGGEMQGVEKDWRKAIEEKGSETSKAKLAAFQEIKTHLKQKPSAGYTEDGPHDFMHNKVLVADEQLVVTGSYNFSENAEGNAENQLTIEDAGIAKSYADYIATLIAKYPSP
ncbi:MAG TPA: phospholipase D-like domain-containing protein [Solirubrobacteraceae bacterium]|nr:phospholipase D-like domain-containing protein [Solirubrobacteraceae bacterium]